MKNITKYFVIIGLLTVSFVFGVTSGHYKYFPANIFVKYKYGEVLPSWKGRNLDASIHEEIDVTVTTKTGAYLTYGQSNSTNFGYLENRGFNNT